MTWDELPDKTQSKIIDHLISWARSAVDLAQSHLASADRRPLERPSLSRWSPRGVRYTRGDSYRLARVNLERARQRYAAVKALGWSAAKLERDMAAIELSLEKESQCER